MSSPPNIDRDESDGGRESPMQIVAYDGKTGGIIVKSPSTSPQHPPPNRPPKVALTSSATAEEEDRGAVRGGRRTRSNNRSLGRLQRAFLDYGFDGQGPVSFDGNYDGADLNIDDDFIDIDDGNQNPMGDDDFEAALEAMNPAAASYLLDHLLNSLLAKSRRGRRHRHQTPTRAGGLGGGGSSFFEEEEGPSSPISVLQRRQLLLLQAYRQKVMLQRNGNGGRNQTTAATTPTGGELVSYTSSYPHYNIDPSTVHVAPQDISYPHSSFPMVPYEPPVLCCPTCKRPFPAIPTDPPFFTPSYFRTLPIVRTVENGGRNEPAHAAVPQTHSATSTAAEKGDEDVDSEVANALRGGYYQQHFEEIRKIGSGTFGGVYACRHMVCGESLGVFAVKKVPIGDDVEYLRTTLREVRLLEEVRRHPNVVEYHHSWVDYARTADFGPVVRCLFILQEYASEGSLDSYFMRQSEGVGGGILNGEEQSAEVKQKIRREQLRQKAARLHQESDSMLDAGGMNAASSTPPISNGIPALHRLSNAAVWYFFLSAVAGTRHLHNKGILHRDLKPQNLLLSTVDDVEDENGVKHPRPPRVMVSDFGTAAVISDLIESKTNPSGSSIPRTGATGTMEYMAPELFVAATSVKSPVSEGASPTTRYLNHHTKASDMYALGLILHYLAFGGVLPANAAAPIIDSRTGQPILASPPPDVVKLDITSPHHPHNLGSADERGKALVRPLEMIGLIQLLLSRDPKRRPSCDDILSSHYIKGLLEAFERTSWEEITSYREPDIAVGSQRQSAKPSTFFPSQQRASNVDADGQGTTPSPLLPRTQSAFLDELDASVHRDASEQALVLAREDTSQWFVVPYRPTEVRGAKLIK